MVHSRPDPTSTTCPTAAACRSLTGDIRHLIPKLGLREYWYPLCGAGRVKKNKPLRVRMLGEDICIFQGKAKGEINAIGDVCPHRGARLSEGDCHYDGTVACPYHGWVFDGQGNNVAILSEGADSIVCGKPGTEARAYPTQVLKGIVFIWMGDGVAGADRGGRGARSSSATTCTSSSTSASTGRRTGRSRSRTRWTRTCSTCTATT